MMTPNVSRKIERDQRDDVLEAVGPHVEQRPAHALTFQLEDADRFRARQEIVGFLVVERNAGKVDVDAALLDEPRRGLQHGQSGEAEEIELHQPRLLDPFHVELRHQRVRFRIAVERHELGERPVADHDAGRVGRGVAVEALELLRDREGARHHRLLVACRLQARLVGDRARERDRRRRILRDELAQLVDLPVRHLQHAADIAQHAARLQGAERDDLRHLIAAVALLHVVDDLVAPVLAEIDVEVGHRHALEIEEALEQQAETDGVEIGNGERIGGERARARPAPRADRDALRLRPLNEIGDDQEVARIFRLLDDGELDGETFPILLLGPSDGDAMHGHAQPKAFLGARAQLGVLVAAFGRGEARQDRLLRLRAERAALGDLDRRGERLGQVGKKLAHLGARLEAVLGREMPALRIGEKTALGDADQRIVRLVVLGRRKIRLVGRNERQSFRIGEVDQRRFRGPFFRETVTLQFDVEPVAEQTHERLRACVEERHLAGHDRAVERPAGPAGERDEPVAGALEPGKLEVRRFVGGLVEKGARVEPHEVAVTLLARREQHDARQVAQRRSGDRRARPMILVAEIERDRAADDRLDPDARELLRELERAEHVVGVGERERRLPVRLGEIGEARDRQRTFEQRIGRVHVQVHESDVSGHEWPLRMDPRKRILRRSCAGSPRLSMVGPGSTRSDAQVPCAQAGASAHSAAMTCAHTASMPRNSEIDASAAASSTTARNMATSHQERTGNIVPFLFRVNGSARSAGWNAGDG